VDFGMNVGTPVKAITAGKVLYAGWDSYGGGNTLTIQESDGAHTQFYMHLNSFNVKAGDSIKIGQVIAYSGNTGNTSGPHLHFQRMNGVASNETAVDPLPFLKSLGYGSTTTPTTPTNDGYKVNQYGTLYKAESGTFTANTAIIKRYTGPFLSMPQAGTMQSGTKVRYNEVMKQDGHMWISYTDSSGRDIFVPIRTWDKATNKLGTLWGTIVK